MYNRDFLNDPNFLQTLNNEKLKFMLVKIAILDNDEKIIKYVEGRISSGNITINGSSNIRRAGSINFVLKEDDDISNIRLLFSINTKIKIFIGLENNIDKQYEDIIWFQAGVFIITQPNITHNMSGINISLSFKDKMCLLNGEFGGTLPASVVFDSYDQNIEKITIREFPPSEPNENYIYYYAGSFYRYSEIYGFTEDAKYEQLAGTSYSVKQRIFDIIQTCVVNYGNENFSNVIINDVPLVSKQIVRYVGNKPLYVKETSENGNKSYIYTLNKPDDGATYTFKYNDDCGYEYVDFVYPTELVTGIGDSVCSVLDKIIQFLGNYEYFYDVEGHFVFQEKKNYLNKTYVPIEETDDLYIIGEKNYYVDFNNTDKSIYTFNKNNGLINSYTNNPNYSNIKNDYNIWGKNGDGFPIHYHLMIKSKPNELRKRSVNYEKDKYGDFTGKILLPQNGEKGDNDNYIPNDWRAEIYLQALEKKQKQQRPNAYEQELLDFLIVFMI